MDQNRTAPRVPFETNVYLEFERFSGFISEYSFNISESGIFIKSNTPMPIGTALSFEFRLKDHFSLIQGMGEVVWVRTHTQSPDRPAGMGIKFRELSPQSRELIRTMTNNVLQQGGKPFELEEPMKQTESTAKNIGNLFEDTAMPSSPPKSSTNLSGSLKEDFAAIFNEDAGSKEPEFVGRIEDSQAEAKIPLNPHTSMVEIGSPVDLKAPPVNKVAFGQKPSPRAASFQKKWLWGSIGLSTVLLAGAGYWYTQQPIRDETLISGSSQASAWNSSPKVKSPAPAVVPPENTSSAASVPPASTSSIAEVTTSATPTTAESTPSTTVADASSTATATATPMTPAATAPVNTASQTATEVKNISWEAKGTTWILKIEGNGLWSDTSYNLESIRQGKPREVIKLFNISKKYPKLSIPVNTAELMKIRTGHHPALTPPQLHLVLDLKDPQLKFTTATNQGTDLHFNFEKSK